MIINPNRIWERKDDGIYYLYLVLNGQKKCVGYLKSYDDERWYMCIQKDFSYIDTDYYHFNRPTPDQMYKCESTSLVHCKEEVEWQIETAMKCYWRLALKVFDAWRKVDYSYEG